MVILSFCHYLISRIYTCTDNNYFYLISWLCTCTDDNFVYTCICCCCCFYFFHTYQEGIDTRIEVILLCGYFVWTEFNFPDNSYYYTCYKLQLSLASYVCWVSITVVVLLNNSNQSSVLMVMRPSAVYSFVGTLSLSKKYILLLNNLCALLVDYTSFWPQIILYLKIKKTVALKFKRYGKISELKAFLCKKEGISESHQQLFFFFW